MKPSIALILACFAPTALAQTPRLGETHRMLPHGISKGGALGDLDGDGDLDLLPGGYPPEVLRNDGTGAYVPVPGSLPGDVDDLGRPTLADVDGDGDLDALCVSWSGVTLYLNDGGGRFAEATWALPSSAGTVADLTLGDVDHDGDLDVVLATFGFGFDSPNWGEPNALWLNEGSGRFQDSSGLPNDAEVSQCVALEDLDVDGDLDLLVGNGEGWGQADRLYLGDGAGGFMDASHLLPSAMTQTQAIDVADLDGDGDLDVLLADADESAPARLYLWNGVGYTDGSGLLPPAPAWADSVLLEDLDGDGDADILLGSTYDPALLYWNRGGGLFELGEGVLTQADTGVPRRGDVDGDGDADLVWTGGTIGNRLYLHDGRGAYVDATFDGLRGYPHATGDIDGDGVPDFVGGVHGVGLTVILGDGYGGLTVVPDAFPPEVLGSARILEDLDADGDLDALVSIGNTDYSIFWNDGTGNYQAVPSTSLGEWGWRAAAGDVDGDGLPDVLLVGDDEYLFVNQGSGTFLDASHRLPVDGVWSRAAALGDVDGDGDLDVLIGNASWPGSPNALYLNDGAGWFSDASFQLPGFAEDTSSLAFGDVDGDGDLDCLVGNTGGNDGQQNRLYINQGGGVMVDGGTRLPDDADTTRVVRLVDLDSDGDLDAFTGDYPDRIYLNDGQGTFTEATEWIPSAGPSLLPVGDVDGDGDFDFVGWNSGQVRIVRDLSLQLAWRALPRVGKPLTLDLHGVPHAPWQLSVSEGGAQPPPGMGAISPFRIMACGVLDARGRAAHTFEVPLDPSLVGVTWTWSAVVDGRKTNLERTTFREY